MQSISDLRSFIRLIYQRILYRSMKAKASTSRHSRVHRTFIPKASYPCDSPEGCQKLFITLGLADISHIRVPVHSSAEPSGAVKINQTLGEICTQGQNVFRTGQGVNTTHIIHRTLFFYGRTSTGFDS